MGVSPCITPVARWLGSTKSSGSVNTATPLRRRVAPRTRSKSAVSRRPGSGFSRQPPTPVPGWAGRDRARPFPGPSRRSACPGEPEVFRSLRLELVRQPDPLHRGVGEAGLGHRVLAPVRAVRRPGVQRHSRRPAGPIGLHRRLAGWPAGLLEQAGNAARPIALPPQPHSRLAGLQRRAIASCRASRHTGARSAPVVRASASRCRPSRVSAAGRGRRASVKAFKASMPSRNHTHSTLAKHVRDETLEGQGCMLGEKADDRRPRGFPS